MADGKVRVHPQRFLALLHRFVKEMSDAQCIAHVCADDQGEGIKALRLFQLSNAFTTPPHHHQMPCIPKMCSCVAGVQLDRYLVFCFGSLPVPAIKVESESEGGVGLAEAIVQCHGYGGCCLRFAKSILRR